MIVYFVLTFAVTWGLWFAAGVSSPAGPHGPLVLMGVFTPAVIALSLTAVEEGRAGVIALLRRLIDWEHPVRWYVFAMTYVAAIKITAAVAHRVILGVWPAFGTESILLMIAATLASTFSGGQAGEEVGWRGYALPRLATRFGLPWASVVLGVVWASWHLPLFFAHGVDKMGQSFPLYLLQVTALSVALAWLWSHTRGSLLPVMLMHAAGNNTKDIVPSVTVGATNPWAFSGAPVAWLSVALLWICAGYFLVRMRPKAR
ncbi:MAG: type II CAAX endopeptidase family protein [Gemmatimonadota bacterium]